MHTQYTCDPCTHITLPPHTNHAYLRHALAHPCTHLAPHPHPQTLLHKKRKRLTGVSKGQLRRMRRQDKDAKEGCGSRRFFAGAGQGRGRAPDRGCCCPGNAGWGRGRPGLQPPEPARACPSEPAARPQPVTDTHPHPAMHAPMNAYASHTHYTHAVHTHCTHIYLTQSHCRQGGRWGEGVQTETLASLLPTSPPPPGRQAFRHRLVAGADLPSCPLWTAWFRLS